jgi:hypothetical protein
MPKFQPATIPGLTVTSGDVTINDGSLDADFRVESDDNTHMLFVDAGNDRVGIGTSTPISTVDIEDGLTTVGAVLTLSTKEPTVVDEDVIGQINFRAPLETGADALLLLASISAVANEAFDADQNQTELVLSTASGAAAAERVRVTHDGDVQVAGLTASEIVITDANKGLTSAAVATYPSLAELAHVKGVTSAVQTQLDATANVATNLTISGTTGARTIESSDGTNATIPIATTSVAGVMSKAIFDQHTTNVAKATNVDTDLGVTTSTTTITVTSSDGDNAELPVATTSAGGVMSKAIFDAVTANTAKATNATHTGDVTGSGALTIAADAVTYAKLQNLGTANRVLGSASTGLIGEVQIVVDMMAADSVDSAQYVNGSIDNEHLATGIDSVKIADGSVTNTEFQYISTLSSNAQTQLDTKEQIGKKTMWIPAAAMYANTTAGCSALTQVELANGPELKVLDFAADADDHAQFTISMPKSWNEGTITFQPYWTVTAGTNTGTVVWGMSAVACADNATQNVTFGSIAVTAAKAHSGTSNDINVSAESAALTIKAAAVDTLTYFQIFNDTSASGQTGVVRLTGVKILYTTDAVNDA